METGTYISKSAAGLVLGVLLVGVCAVSGYALRDGAVVAVATVPTRWPGMAASDTLEADEPIAAAPGRMQPTHDFGTEGEHSPKDSTAAKRSGKRGSTAFFAAGTASFYGYRFEGRPTASGESFDPRDMTAAHPTLPFGTRVRVTNIVNGRSVEVRINDRGPYAKGRIIDLSRGAAEKLGMIRSGTAKVTLELLL